MPRSLFARFYLSVLGLIVLCAIAAFVAWHFFGQAPARIGGYNWVTELAREKLPASLTTSQTNEQLRGWAQRVNADLMVVSSSGQVLGRAGEPFTLPSEFAVWREDKKDGWLKLDQELGRERGRRFPWTYGVALDDGERWIFMRRLPRRQDGGAWMGSFGPNPIRGFSLALAAIVVLLALVSYPMLRRLTRRLHLLEQGVAKFGQGDLKARAQVGGTDEIARVANTFNQAADQVQGLVQAQRSLLANASHELRSPLARLKMAVELSGDAVSPHIRHEFDTNVAELDTLIEEILLSSRLDASKAGSAQWQMKSEVVDLLALAHREALAFEVQVNVAGAEPFQLTGDPRLLQRLLRNLLENARRYAPQRSPEVSLSRDADWLLLAISDFGPGVAVAERERIFEPFYRAAGSSESAGGVGLGLSLVRQIVQLHGGTVVCTSRVDGANGSRFECRFPLTLSV
jgi:signal transduction histidine kinase